MFSPRQISISTFYVHDKDIGRLGGIVHTFLNTAATYKSSVLVAAIARKKELSSKVKLKS